MGSTQRYCPTCRLNRIEAELVSLGNRPFNPAIDSEGFAEYQLIANTHVDPVGVTVEEFRCPHCGAHFEDYNYPRQD